MSAQSLLGTGQLVGFIRNQPRVIAFSIKFELNMNDLRILLGIMLV